MVDKPSPHTVGSLLIANGSTGSERRCLTMPYEALSEMKQDYLVNSIIAFAQQLNVSNRQNSHVSIYNGHGVTRRLYPFTIK